MSDGPNGVRGTACKYHGMSSRSITDGQGTNGAASACFPCATGLAASFDVDLGRSVGEALGKECRARGVHCLLGPTTNIQRHPYGGRGFESFSEGAQRMLDVRAALTFRPDTRRFNGRSVGERCSIAEGHDE
jgi:beta-glucosidase